MKKFIMLLGVASLFAASPVFAATTAKAPMKPMAAHTQMCMLHGKKVPCKNHVIKTKHKSHGKAAATKKSSY